MHEDYVKLAEEKLQQKDDEVWQAYNNMEYYKGQIEEEQERTRNMATNRDVFRHDMKMWHDRFDEKAEEYAELETKHQDMSQKYQEMSDLYNEAVRMKQETDGMMKRADRDKDKAVDDFRDMKIRWQTQLGENRKLEAEKNEWKKKYEELAAEQAARDQAAQRNKVDPQEYAQMEKKLKEGMKMNMADLEALNLKLQRDNEAYHKANRELSERLALARAPAEILVAAANAFASASGLALQQDASSELNLPSAGSTGHHLGQCRPCAFWTTKGCSSGQECQFCHLCAPGEKKRRQKAKRAFFGALAEMQRCFTGERAAEG
eukprot:s878_g20.t1